MQKAILIMRTKRAHATMCQESDCDGAINHWTFTTVAKLLFFMFSLWQYSLRTLASLSLHTLLAAPWLLPPAQFPFVVMPGAV